MTNQSPRIRGRKWMAIRERVMARDCGLCQTCLRNGLTTIGKQVDHIVALINGGSNGDDNLECICESCHQDKTDADLGHAPKVTTGLDGWPMPQERSTGPVWRRKGYR